MNSGTVLIAVLIDGVNAQSPPDRACSGRSGEIRRGDDPTNLWRLDYSADGRVESLSPLPSGAAFFR